MARTIVRRLATKTDVRWLAPVALMLVASTSSAVMADEWSFSADFFTALTYTDNVILTPSPGEEEEYVWELSPTIIAARDGKRVDIEFDYRLQGLLYAREDSRNEVYNYLQTRLEADVIPDLLHFDADVSISQTVVDPLIASGNSSISVSGNSAEVMTINVSPYIERALTPTTQFRAGASAGLIEYDETQLVDNKQRNYFASVVNQSRGGPFSWTVDYRSTSVEYDVGQEIELARISGEVGLRLTPRTEFVVSGGEDINDFGALPGTRVAEGTFWDAGFRGSLGSTITFDIRAGEQFFGESYGVTFNRTSRALETNLGYTEEATTVGAQQLDFSSALSLLDITGNFNNQLDVNGFELPTRDPELYIRRRFNFSNSLQSGKSTFVLGFFYEDRQFIRTVLAGARENVRGARAEWSWAYNDVTTLETRASYQLLDSRDTVSRPEDLRLSVLLRREIFNDSYLQVVLANNTRSAPSAAEEYDEVTLRLGFGRRF